MLSGATPYARETAGRLPELPAAAASVGTAPVPALPDGHGLRVAIISDAAPERNGVGAYYRDLAEHLRAAGAQVELIAPRYRAGRWYGGLALPLPGDPTQRFLIPSPWLLYRRLRRLRPTAVIVPTPGPFGLLGMLLARWWRVPLVVGFHTHLERLTELNAHTRLFGALARGYLNGCNRLLFRAGRLTLANSPDMVRIARAMGARAAGLMGTPVPKHFLDAPVQPLRTCCARVLFAGRLAPEKNLGAVIAAAERLPELQFQIAGDGPLRDRVVAEAARLPNLTYRGWVKRARILPLIDANDVLVLPSTIESFGTIALEAMARGRLVVVSSQCGILSWELLRDGLFEIGPDEDLATALARVAELDAETLTARSLRARAAAAELNARNLGHWLGVLRDGNLDGLVVD